VESGPLPGVDLDDLDHLLSGAVRDPFGAIHPSFMGGEYLPPLRKDEVEIARVELESTTGDVTSIRAAKEGDLITYSIVDEYDTEFDVSPASSAEPLTLVELVTMLDGASEGESLALVYTEMNYAGNESRGDLESLKSFTRVESQIYPALAEHHRKLTESWYRREKKRLTGEASAES
ncbi:MAG: hypothetical protein H0W20_11585, partial [Chthoniobacterales bacterium]|nr:hypothetical protein [Chthoniobacterales bacterium]